MNTLEGLLWTIGLFGFAATVYFLLSYKAPLSNDCPRKSDTSSERWPHSF